LVLLTLTVTECDIVDDVDIVMDLVTDTVPDLVLGNVVGIPEFVTVRVTDLVIVPEVVIERVNG
jgi:hypothetical protein